MADELDFNLNYDNAATPFDEEELKAEGDEEMGSMFIESDFVDAPADDEFEKEQDRGFEMPLQEYANRDLVDSVVLAARRDSDVDPRKKPKKVEERGKGEKEGEQRKDGEAKSRSRSNSPKKKEEDEKSDKGSDKGSKKGGDEGSDKGSDKDSDSGSSSDSGSDK